MCCTWLAENTWRKNYTKKSPSAHHRTTLSGYIFATKAYIDNRKKLVKQQHHLNKSSQCGELRSTNGWDRLASLGHPANFNAFRVFASLLHRRRSTEVYQTLHDVWPSSALVHYIYIFGGCCAVTEFCQVQSLLFVQVLRSAILTALLHGTRAAGVVSQTLWRGIRWNGITELSLFLIFNRGRHLYSVGGHHIGHRPTL